MTSRPGPLDIPGPLGRRTRRWRPAWVRAAGLLSTVLGAGLHRLFDVVLAAGVLVGLSPLLAVRALVARARAGAVLARTPLVGRFRTPFERLDFADTGLGRALPRLVNILRGDMSFAGPRPLARDEAAAVPADAAERFEVRPGLVSVHSLRRRTGVAYDTEAAQDREFVYTQTLRGDIGLLARSVPGMVLGGSDSRPAPPVLDFFGVPVVNTTMDEAVEWIVERARQATPSQVCFVNPDCLNIAYEHEAYRSVLRTCARVLPDGIGIHLACQLTGSRLVANVNGTDMFPRLCERIAGTDLSIFLLGARPEIAAAAAAAMQDRYPGLRVAGTQHGYFSADEEAAVIDAINASGAHVLLVAFGVPRQELWLHEHAARLRPPVRLGVGGLFDFYSGRIPRAPVWMREIGLEWVWRLLQEPGRMWRRYLVGNPLFLYRVARYARSVSS